MREFTIGAAVVFVSIIAIVFTLKYLFDHEGDDIFLRHGILEQAH